MKPIISHAQHELGASLSVHLHITGNGAHAEHVADDVSDSKSDSPVYADGRPQLPTIVRSACKEGNAKVAIIGTLNCLSWRTTKTN